MGFWKAARDGLVIGTAIAVLFAMWVHAPKGAVHAANGEIEILRARVRKLEGYHKDAAFDVNKQWYGLLEYRNAGRLRTFGGSDTEVSPASCKTARSRKAHPNDRTRVPERC